MGLGLKLRQKKGQVDVRPFKHKVYGSQEREELETKTRMGEHEIMVILVRVNRQPGTAWSFLRRESQLKDYPEQIALWAYCMGLSFVIFIGGSSPLWVAPFLGQVGLSCIKKLSKYEPVNQQEEFLLGFCFKLLP